MVERDPMNRGTSGAGTGAQQSGGTGGDVKQQVGDVAGQVKEQAVQLKDKVAETATSKLDDQKTQATAGLGNVSDAIRQAGEQLRSNDQEVIAQYIDRAAEQIDQFTGYLKKRDMRQLVGDVEAFARREPAIFLGGAFVLGLLGARFLKSSSQAIETRGTDWQSRQGYGTQAALSSYSSYSAMQQTQQIPVQYDAPATYAPTASATSYPTPTSVGGTAGLGTGGSVTPARPSTATPPPVGGASLGSTSSGTGAPGWQGGASGATGATGATGASGTTPPARPSDRIPGTGGRETPGSGFTAREGRDGNTRSGGDAGA